MDKSKFLGTLCIDVHETSELYRAAIPKRQAQSVY